MIRVAVGQTQSGIVDEAGGTVSDMADRRQHPGGSRRVIGLPQTLGHPGSANVVADERLIGHGPARFAALHEIDQTRPVSPVSVVVPGEEIPVVVEGEFLGIAHPRREDFERRAVRIHPEHRAPPRSHGGFESLAFLRHHGVAAVSHREVDLPVRAPDESVKIVPDQRGLDAETGLQDFVGFGHAVAIHVAHPAHVRDRGDVDLAELRFDSRHEPRRHAVPGGEFEARIRHAIAVPILEHDEAIALLREVIGILELPRRQPFLVVGDAILDRTRGEIVLEPIRMRAVVLGPDVLAPGLGDEHATPLVDIQGDRRRAQQGLVEDARLHPFEQLGFAARDGAGHRRPGHATDDHEDVVEGFVRHLGLLRPE